MSQASESLVAPVYHSERVKCLEIFYGEGFLSSEGEAKCKASVEHLKLKAGDSILDVGTGSGGFAFYLAEHVGAVVTGVDYCTNLVDLCNERCKKKVLGDKISFLAKDMRDMQFKSKSFDAISFLGSLIHIKCEEHLPIFTNVRNWLKPGGRVIFQGLVTCDCPASSTQEFKDYRTSLHFNDVTVADYHKLIPMAGLRLLEYQSRKEFYIQDTITRQAKVKENWNQILKVVSIETLEHCFKFFADKRKWAEEGAMFTCIFLAERPRDM
ncbi:uncharacterized protein LOC134177233 [Corticium candelabrum]|uniref:uncharacterized protein LOC134177233 n=1 Tax=Corticium candelabrum TaxID=121492 RepID=UPI002E274D9E|nr:uncharacterized protein LOC134177233 [Corticium candelabrum]